VTVGLPLIVQSGEDFLIPENRQVVLSELEVQDGGLVTNEGLITVI
jgi:hypothetical protein